MKAEKCPYHDIEPEYRIHVFREAFEKEYVDAGGNTRIMVFPRLADHYWFCPGCRDGIGEHSPKLGVGYYSQLSKETALSNWNKAMVKLVPELIRRAARGKTS